ncbi:MAG: DNRLRE domain-containing protein, partial [Flavobacteriales bacterium]
PDEVDSCLTINTYGKSGKDAYLDYINLNSNYGSHADFAATAWTNSGNTAISRGIIDFDFSDIPSGSTINSANLSLYAYDSPSNGSHSTQSGSNAAVIKRVTSSWEENTVTWNNQPTTTSTNEVSLPASTTTLQDYDVDMTDLVQDVIDNPTTSFGFMFKLLTEQYYRRMLFASSDHSNEALHPTLEVCFTPPTSVSVVEETPKGLVLDIFPNPANDQITIDLQHLNQPLASVELINTSGQLVMKLVDNQKLIAFDVSELPQGLYVVKVNTEANSITQKVIID